MMRTTNAQKWLSVMMAVKSARWLLTLCLALTLPVDLALAQDLPPPPPASTSVKPTKPNAELSAPGRWPFPQRWLPVDEAGWTILKPSNDARIIYVSSKDGDDAAAKTYSLMSPEIGPDPVLPAGALKPYATIERAMEQARPGQGDWVLLKRGDSWSVGAAHRMPNGRSVSEPTVFGAYGPGAEPPILRGDPLVIVGDDEGGAEYVVVTGIELYDSKKDPKSPDYAVVKGKEIRDCGLSFNVGKGNAFKNVLVEDCLLRYAMVRFINWAKERRADTPITDVVIRRSLILDQYRSVHHTMGIWASNASFLLEECILDHNGWLNYPTPENIANQEPGIAQGRSHNTYLCNCYNMVFRDNMFLRGASIGNKWSAISERGFPDLIVDNNLYVANEIVLSAGGNGKGGHRFVNTAILNNVATYFGRDQGPSMAVGMEISDWDGGIIAHNLFRGPCFAGVKQDWVFLIGSRQWKKGTGWGGTAPMKATDPPLTPGKGLRDVLITGNTYYGLEGGSMAVQFMGPGLGNFLERVTFRNNRLQAPEVNKPLVRIAAGDLKNFTFSGNAYHSGATNWFTVGSSPVNFQQWVAATGDKDATDKPVDFSDPQRSLLAYLKHLGREPTLEAFYRECRQQSKRNWRPQFTAAAVNAWIRQGFDIKKAELKKDASGWYLTPFQLE